MAVGLLSDLRSLFAAVGLVGAVIAATALAAAVWHLAGDRDGRGRA